MIDLSNISLITAEYDGVLDALSGNSNNPIAESEITEVLKEAVRRNITVRLKIKNSSVEYNLVLEGDDLKISQ